MEDIIKFSPIIKYILIFVITFMFLNNINVPIDKILGILAFVILISIAFDIFMFTNYFKIIDKNKMLLNNKQELFMENSDIINNDNHDIFEDLDD